MYIDLLFYYQFSILFLSILFLLQFWVNSITYFQIVIFMFLKISIVLSASLQTINLLFWVFFFFSILSILIELQLYLSD